MHPLTFTLVAALLGLSFSVQQRSSRSAAQGANTASVAVTIAGDVFVVTKGGTNYKLGLVPIAAIPEAAVKAHLEERRRLSQAAVAKIQPDIDKARKAYSDATAADDRLWAESMKDIDNQTKY